MKYALDAEHNLVPGDVLTFKYQGSGVATFVDKDGTGFRVPIGIRNLAGVSADGTVQLENTPLSLPMDTPVAFADLDRDALKELCRSRDIPFKGNPGKPLLITLLEDALTVRRNELRKAGSK